ncbi:MAG: hypothetical protein ABI686_14155 [Acidobacteriota bacterium]
MKTALFKRFDLHNEIKPREIPRFPAKLFTVGREFIADFWINY